MSNQAASVKNPTSDADITKGYPLRANCYLTKPVQLDRFKSLVRSINEFWLTKARLPPQWQAE